jgi:prepilin signal peptidase PulO-like enzyme (type II secretory pathway)
LVELAAGLLFVLVFQQFGFSLASIFAAIIWSVLLFIYAHDGRTMIIPRWAVWTFNALAFAGLFLALPADSLAFSQAALVAPGWLKFLSGPIIALPFVAIWLFSGGRAMGLGDGKLVLGIGWLLSLPEAVSAVMLSFWIGALVSLALIGLQQMWKSATTKRIMQPIIKLGQSTEITDPEENNIENEDQSDARADSVASGKDITMKTAVPFGPFLICGLLIVYFTGLTLL